MASVVTEIEGRIAELRAQRAEGTRTSVLTHVAWVPPRWADVARDTLAGLEERHPSRTILLFPESSRRDGVEAKVSLRCFEIPGSEREICSDVIELRLRGAPARRPGSLVEPLLVVDLPSFCRWRGLPPWGAPELESLVTVCARLVVDSAEWRGVPAAYRKLERLFDRIAVSDIAWGRGAGWRGRLAERWPGIGGLKTLSVTGPKADALLLAGWLRSRLDRRVRLVHRSAAVLERVLVDGDEVTPPRGGPPRASELLSGELDQFARDPVYEAAVRAAR
jgi:glucose-6-phosphate dehydrogenase assembly protein OpcA